MKTLYLRSPTTSSPTTTTTTTAINNNEFYSSFTSDSFSPSSSNNNNNLKQFYDEDEQIEMIESYYKNASVQYKIYSYSIGMVSGLCSLLFLYFALIGEDFGESIGMERIRLVHTLSSIGLLTLSIRCFYRYTIWKQSTINYILNSNNNLNVNSNNYLNVNNNTANGGGTNMGYNDDWNLNNSNLSVGDINNITTPYTNTINTINNNNNTNTINTNNNNNNNNNRSQSSIYFVTPSTILTDHPMMNDDDESIMSSTSIPTSTPSQVIENSKNVQIIGNLKVPQVLFICLFISILVAVFELLLWTPSMSEHYQLLTQVSTPIGKEHFKLAILVFPLVLPVMIIASEYGHYLLNQNFVDIIDLNNHRYKFKKL